MRIDTQCNCMGKIVSREVQQQIIDMTAQGKMPCEIIAATGLSHCTVRRYSQRTEPVDAKYRTLTVIRAEIQAMIDSGMDYKQISKITRIGRIRLRWLFGRDKHLKRRQRKGIITIETYCRLCDEIMLIEMNNEDGFHALLMHSWSGKIATCPRCKQDFQIDLLIDKAELERAWKDAFVSDDEADGE